jgi:hypothetical protein
MILVNPRPIITYEDTEHACLAYGLFRPTLIFFVCLVDLYWRMMNCRCITLMLDLASKHAWLMLA